MMKLMQRGFTLIELLVVIAIIGILAAVVLASLNDARTSGTNAAIQQTINNVRSQAEITYNSNTPVNYDGICTNGSEVDRLLDSVVAQHSHVTGVTLVLGEPSTAAIVACHEAADNNSYAVSAPLGDTDGTQRWYCVDSDGNAGISTTALVADATVCPS